MERVTGIGGIFFKTQDPQSLQRWYTETLGVPSEHGQMMFRWEDPSHPQRKGTTALGMFAQDSDYFGPEPSPFMINFRVRDLDAMLTQLRAAGAKVDDHVQDTEYGRFAWFVDPAGHRVELWEPPPAK